MSWDDLRAVFAVEFADDIAVVVAGQTEAFIPERLELLGAEERALLREAFAENGSESRETL